MVQELNEAESHHIRGHQWQMFCGEISHLKSGKHLSRCSNLNSLLPLMDWNDILRVGGRNKHSNLSHDQQHPVKLTGKAHLARLII